MKVRIKTWQEMASQYKDNGDSIDIWGGWTIDMENLLPQDRIIEVQPKNMNLNVFSLARKTAMHVKDKQTRRDIVESKISKMLWGKYAITPVMVGEVLNG